MADRKEKRARIRNIKDTTENWEKANPILLDGEIGFEVMPDGSVAIKIGDGKTAWKLLKYITKTTKEAEKGNQYLQDQIDNIVLTASGDGDAAAEVAQARISIDGTNFATLKERLDAEQNALKTDILKVKEDLDRVSDNFDKFFEFEMGIFSPGTTNNIYVENSSTNRMITPVFTVNKDTTIRLIDDTRKVVVCVQDDESGTNYEQLPTLSIDNKEMSIVANNRFYRVMIMNSDFSNITDEEEIAKSVVYLYKDENVNCAIEALYAEISKIETQISNQTENIVPIAISDLTKNGVSFTSDGQGVYVLNGTATSDAVYMIYDNVTTLPSGVENDKRYTIIREGTADIYISVAGYDVNGTITSLLSKVTTTETEFTTPSEAVGLQIKFYAKSGVNYDNAEVTLKMYDTEKYKASQNGDTLNEINKRLDALENKCVNPVDVIPIGTTSQEKNNVGITPNNGTYTINGTPTADTVCYIYNNQNIIPSSIIAGEKYVILHNCDIVVRTSIAYYKTDGNIVSLVNTEEKSLIFTLPSEAVGLQIKFYAVTGKTYSNTEVVFEMYDYIGYAEKNHSHSPLYKKSVTFNGDSICYGVGYLGGYGKIIADTYDMDYENIAVGGATVIQGLLKSDGVTPRHSVSATIANMNSEADYIIIEGGVNDANEQRPMGAITDGFDETLDTSTYYGAFEYMLKELVTRFAGKKIGYIAVHKWVSGYDSRYTENSYYYAAKECCKKWGVPVCDLNTLVPPLSLIDSLKTAYIASSVHPNEAGYRRYYVPKIIAFMERL